MANVANLRKELSGNLDIYEQILSKQPYLGGQVISISLNKSLIFFLHMLDIHSC
jgi:hypothetical protein